MRLNRRKKHEDEGSGSCALLEHGHGGRCGVNHVVVFGAQDIANLAGNEAERRAPSFQPKTVIIKMQYSDLQVTASFERLAPYPHPWNGARWFHGDFKLLAVEVHGEIIAESTSGADSAAATKK